MVLFAMLTKEGMFIAGICWDPSQRHRQVVELSLSFSEQTNLSECNFLCDIMPDCEGI